MDAAPPRCATPRLRVRGRQARWSLRRPVHRTNTQRRRRPTGLAKRARGRLILPGMTTSSPAVSGESNVLVSCLNEQREQVPGIVDGLPAEALRRPVLPSAWACLG